jgi:hypothetical protein
MERIGIKPPALFKLFTQPPLAVLMVLTIIKYRLGALMLPVTVLVQQLLEKYVWYSQMVIQIRANIRVILFQIIQTV